MGVGKAFQLRFSRISLTRLHPTRRASSPKPSRETDVAKGKATADGVVCRRGNPSRRRTSRWSVCFSQHFSSQHLRPLFFTSCRLENPFSSQHHPTGASTFIFNPRKTIPTQPAPSLYYPDAASTLVMLSRRSQHPHYTIPTQPAPSLYNPDAASTLVILSRRSQHPRYTIPTQPAPSKTNPDAASTLVILSRRSQHPQ